MKVRCTSEILSDLQDLIVDVERDLLMVHFLKSSDCSGFKDSVIKDYKGFALLELLQHSADMYRLAVAVWDNENSEGLGTGLHLPSLSVFDIRSVSGGMQHFKAIE